MFCDTPHWRSSGASPRAAAPCIACYRLPSGQLAARFITEHHRCAPPGPGGDTPLTDRGRSNSPGATHANCMRGQEERVTTRNVRLREYPTTKLSSGRQLTYHTQNQSTHLAMTSGRLIVATISNSLKQIRCTDTEPVKSNVARRATRPSRGRKLAWIRSRRRRGASQWIGDRSTPKGSTAPTPMEVSQPNPASSSIPAAG